jgi:hypothetical protein
LINPKEDTSVITPPMTEEAPICKKTSKKSSNSIMGKKPKKKNPMYKHLKISGGGKGGLTPAKLNKPNKKKVKKIIVGMTSKSIAKAKGKAKALKKIAAIKKAVNPTEDDDETKPSTARKSISSSVKDIFKGKKVKKIMKKEILKSASAKKAAKVAKKQVKKATA